MKNNHLCNFIKSNFHKKNSKLCIKLYVMYVYRSNSKFIIYNSSLYVFSFIIYFLNIHKI